MTILRYFHTDNEENVALRMTWKRRPPSFQFFLKALGEAPFIFLNAFENTSGSS